MISCQFWENSKHCNIPKVLVFDSFIHKLILIIIIYENINDFITLFFINELRNEQLI